MTIPMLYIIIKSNLIKVSMPRVPPKVKTIKAMKPCDLLITHTVLKINSHLNFKRFEALQIYILEAPSSCINLLIGALMSIWFLNIAVLVISRLKLP